MPGNLYIPPEVKAAIAAHFRSAIARASDAYMSGAEDEDVLTGQLGALLRIKDQKVFVANAEIRGDWTWSIDYTKFRGRGAKATESILGADGIFELRLTAFGSERTKTLLFQAKNSWESDGKLLEQAVKLSTWREAACVIDFRKDSIDAYSLDSVVRGGGTRRPEAAEKLDEFLGTRYLDCDVGDTELIYDAISRTLSWRSQHGRRVATSFAVGGRFRINVKAPRNQSYDRDQVLTVPHSDVHNHRMHVTPRDMLGLPYDAPKEEARRAARQIAAVWHPDLFISRLPKELVEIVSRRTQEANAVYEAFAGPDTRPQKQPNPAQDEASAERETRHDDASRDAEARRVGGSLD